MDFEDVASFFDYYSIANLNAQALNLIIRFNQTSAFGRLPPMPYAARTLYDVRNMGRPIYALTSCSADPAVQARRRQNLALRFSFKLCRFSRF